MRFSVQVPFMLLLATLLAVSVSGEMEDKASNPTEVRIGMEPANRVPETEDVDIVHEMGAVEDEDIEEINDAERSYSTQYHYKKPEPKYEHHSDYNYKPSYEPDPKPDPKPHHGYGHTYNHQPRYTPKRYACPKTCYATSYLANRKCHYPNHVVSCQRKYKKCDKKYHYGSYKRQCYWAYKSGYGCSCYFH